MSFSFCIITGGNRSELLKTVITSIRAQNIPEYEIIVAGKHYPEADIVYVEAAEAATGGRLGELRNRAVTRANHENIVILDDDIILSPDWYSNFLSYDKPFDILTSQVRVPDGSRYWDHATVGGPKGHIILADVENDDYVYMTGGGGWILKDTVAKSVRWDDNKVYYEEEDVDFSRRCQALGFKISHNHKMLVFHADPTYTCIGRIVARRQEGRTQGWVLSAFHDLKFFQLLWIVKSLKEKGQFAEAADYLRMAIRKGPNRWFFRMLWRIIENKLGGKLPATRWYPTGDSAYLDALERYNFKK